MKECKVIDNLIDYYFQLHEMVPRFEEPIKRKHDRMFDKTRRLIKTIAVAEIVGISSLFEFPKTYSSGWNNGLRPLSFLYYKLKPTTCNDTSRKPSHETNQYSRYTIKILSKQ